MVENSYVPKTIGNFTILRTIAKGGSAVIKLVANSKGDQFAMKVFEPIGGADIIEGVKKEFTLAQNLELA